MSSAGTGSGSVFQPTPSARRVTCKEKQWKQWKRISTHTLRKEGDIFVASCWQGSPISTHTLRKEGDPHRG